MAHSNLFGKPGHGAPTENIRKKRFTEYQLTDASGAGGPPPEEGGMIHSRAGFYAMDDSAVPNTQPSYQGNPYRQPDYESDMMNSRHLSKSEPDISPVSQPY